MTIFKVIQETTNNTTTLARKINYVEDFCSTDLNLIYGSNVGIYSTYKEMVLVKNVFNQTSGKAYIHSVLSLDERDEIDVLEFKNIGVEICEMLAGFRGNYQIVMAIHTNTDNLHIHYMINNIDYITGTRMNLNKEFLQSLKYAINSILVKYNLSEIRTSSNYHVV